MGELSEYIIDLKNLKGESCTYDYVLGDSFFGGMESSLIQKGNVRAQVLVKDKSKSFELRLHVDGIVLVPCDRCLDDMEQPIAGDSVLQVKFGSEYSDTGDDMIVVPEEEGTVDIAWFLYELVALSVPIQHVHADGECNETMTKKLNQYRGRLDNASDPRWDKLKEILNNDNNKD